MTFHWNFFLSVDVAAQERDKNKPVDENIHNFLSDKTKKKKAPLEI